MLSNLEKSTSCNFPCIAHKIIFFCEFLDDELREVIIIKIVLIEVLFALNDELHNISQQEYDIFFKDCIIYYILIHAANNDFDDA